MYNLKALDNRVRNGQKFLMPNELVKFDVQTEGLGEFWGVAPNYHERRSRDPMSAEELKDILLTIHDENGKEANGLFIIEHTNRRVNLRINSGVLEISDPNNANYQNVVISIDDLSKYLEDFFQLQKGGKHVQNSHIIILEWIIALIAGAGMVGAIYFAFQYLDKEVDFMPKPDFVEIQDHTDFQNHLKKMTGIFVTELEDGETLLFIQEDGRWDFFDLERSVGNNFILTEIEGGLCRPVYQTGRLGLLTDSNFIFFWESEGVIYFQDRKYILTAKTSNELPFVSFPD